MMRKLASSSPPMLMDRNPQRAPRRLQLKPSTPLLSSCDDDEGSDSSCHPRQPNAGSRARDGEEAPPSDGSEEGGRYTSGATLISPSSSPPPATRLELSEQPKKPTRTKSAPVQTTINLSTKSTFEECKICQIVFNPLHPPDVKFHTKKHKAILRGLTRS